MSLHPRYICFSYSTDDARKIIDYDNEVLNCRWRNGRNYEHKNLHGTVFFMDPHENNLTYSTRQHDKIQSINDAIDITSIVLTSVFGKTKELGKPNES